MNKTSIIISRLHLRRTALIAALLLLLTALAACDSSKFLVPPASDDVMMKAAMGINCQEGMGSLKVNVDAARVRTGPGLENPTLHLAYMGDSFYVTDLSEDMEWVGYELESGKTGWISAGIVDLMCM